MTFRSSLYRWRWLQAKAFDIPVIAVGNLVVGGAGKSPMVEYLIRLLCSHYRIATLSRGYGRKTTGYLTLKPSTPAELGGDEPMQFKQKFPQVTVAVCESRLLGIENLMHNHQVIILDDAYQHQAVKPGLSILLFEYASLLKTQWVLPAGTLREPWNARKRADLMVVTKAPLQLTPKEREQVMKVLNPLASQQVFFSSIAYEELVPINHANACLPPTLKGATVFLLTAIANPNTLKNKLYNEGVSLVLLHRYPDHHTFNRKNILKLATDFSKNASDLKLIITTEKDAQRLKVPQLWNLIRSLPIYYLPIRVKMHFPEERMFNKTIMEYVKACTRKAYHEHE